MDVRDPVAFHYRKNYIDPLYVPYLRTVAPVQTTARVGQIGGTDENDPTASFCSKCKTKNMGCGVSGAGRDKEAGKYWPPHMEQQVIPGNYQLAEVNRWELANVKPSSDLVENALVRKGWRWGFQRKHPTYPCPNGWTPGVDGWCEWAQEEFEPIFYTDKAFLTKNQYWNGYSENNDKTQQFYGPSETWYRGASLTKRDENGIKRIGCGSGETFGSAPAPTGRNNYGGNRRRNLFTPTGPSYGGFKTKDSYLA